MAVLDSPGAGGYAWRDYPLAGTGEPGTITLKVAAALPTRDVLVALPPGYQAGDARYPVIYMHDGQLDEPRAGPGASACATPSGCTGSWG